MTSRSKSKYQDVRRKRKVPSREDFRYFLTYRSRWSDNDQYSHINNAVYYLLIDSIINTYLAERCGCKPSASTASSSSGPSYKSEAPPIGLVVSSHCNFRQSFSFPELIDLGLRVVALGKSSVTYEVAFFSQGEPDAKAVGGYTHVFVDRVKMRPVTEMSKELRNGLLSILISDQHEAAYCEGPAEDLKAKL